MKKKLCYLFVVFSIGLYAQDTVLVNDDFSNRNKFLDNSLLTLWGGNSSPVSCFELVAKSDSNNVSMQSIAMTSDGMSNSSYTLSTGLKTLNSIDYEIPTLQRRNGRIIIEFDALWSALVSWGEKGRLVITLMHNYPQGGAKFNQVDSVNLIHPFGQPAYNLRIRNTLLYDTTYSQYMQTSPTFMLYGGGLDSLGEFEKYNNTWWLPGFSSEPGGTSPGQPGDKDYPQVPTKKATKPFILIASNKDWKHVTWIIEPEYMHVYQRLSSEPTDSNKLVSYMSIPKDTADIQYIVDKMNSVHCTAITDLPVYYNWFPTVEAVRFYLNGDTKFWVANIKISTTKENIITTTESIVENIHIDVYPNPVTNGHLNISVPRNYTLENIQLYDIAGRALPFQKTMLQNYAQLNVSGIKRGTYILRIYVNGAMYCKKIVLL